MSETKWVYRFGAGITEGDGSMTGLLGNKGANLAEMAGMDLPVPPGFIISTDACRDFLGNGNELPTGISQQIDEALDWLGAQTDSAFGDPDRPLLVSVRSGAPVSMPGMMDTVLNVGLNDETVAAIARETGNKAFSLDCYRRLIQMYGDVVLGINTYLFEDILHDHRDLQGLDSESRLDEDALRQIVAKFQTMLSAENGDANLQDVRQQFYQAVTAVFRSWLSPRAINYRSIHEISDDSGTAVAVQAMVFGNMSDQCASGVAFTRNPSDGAPRLYGEYLPQAQGEEIVGGFRTPHAITEQGRLNRGDKSPSLQSSMPACFQQLQEVGRKLEARFRDMQDIEFTIERGKLWLLQTRTGKRTTEAAIRIALDMLDEGLITQEQAVERVAPEEFDRLLRPVINPGPDAVVIATGLPASPGVASGIVSFTPDEAVALAADGEQVILVRNETHPQDVSGIHAASALLTRRGGMTSHAAVIARAMGRPCIVGASHLRLDIENGHMLIAGKCVQSGDKITIDGTGGRVFAGVVPMKAPEMSSYARRFKALLDG